MFTPEILYQTVPRQQIFIRWKFGCKSLGLGALIVLTLAPLSAQAGSEEGLIYALKPMTATKVTIARQGYLFTKGLYLLADFGHAGCDA